MYPLQNYRSSLIHTPLGKGVQDAGAGQRIYHSSNKPDHHETVKIDQLIRHPRDHGGNFVTQSAGDFREVGITKMATKSLERAPVKKHSSQQNDHLRRHGEQYHPTKQVISPTKIGMHVSGKAQTDQRPPPSAHFKMKSQVTNIRPYTGVKI